MNVAVFSAEHRDQQIRFIILLCKFMNEIARKGVVVTFTQIHVLE